MVPQHHAMFSLRQLLPALLPAAIVLSCLTVATQAGPADCELNKVALARVVTQEARLHFIAGASKRSCPSAARACSLRAYLVPGDEVLSSTPPKVLTFAHSSKHNTRLRRAPGCRAQRCKSRHPRLRPRGNGPASGSAIARRRSSSSPTATK